MAWKTKEKQAGQQRGSSTRSRRSTRSNLLTATLWEVQVSVADDQGVLLSTSTYVVTRTKEEGELRRAYEAWLETNKHTTPVSVEFTKLGAATIVYEP